MTESDIAAGIRREIGRLTREYHRAAHTQAPFSPGESTVPCAGRVLDENDIVALVDAGLDGWLTSGRFAERFEREFARAIGVRKAYLVNSGSSANLVALSSLTSPGLDSRRRAWGGPRLREGDEVITVAAGFPTTVNPIIQNRLVPVFVDVDVPTYNIDVSYLDAARSDRTRAIFLAHTLGNPFDLDAVTAFARQHDLWIIEDCCDAVGSRYRGQNVGTFGDIATTSFYPAHHITMGEGGSVMTSQPVLGKIIESFRDWGRDCWCAPGASGTCGKRFGWQLGDLPHGYDHKYTYSHIGYNLKVTDMQAAIGVSQLAKLAGFGATRRQNFTYLRGLLSDLEEYFVLPEATEGADPSWFGFPLSVREGAPFSRDRIVGHLESARIVTRLLFGGNLIRQPAYRDITCRVVGDLPRSDFVMRNTFWIGVYPGLTREMLDYVSETFHAMVPRLACAAS
ncbi:MAG: lipopolysaccharide biosynthesis protein RfbH [Chloroflexota bacterium]|nr:MAG: lipopolysaccharide biosynthesis protein RfbH [Chloroflexota bacterium]